jgi:hypothetical protein
MSFYCKRNAEGPGPHLLLSLERMPPQPDEATWKLALRAGFRFVLVIGVLFVCAGRLDWPRGWFFIALATITLAVTVPVFQRENPRFLRTRLQKTNGTKPFDK